MGRRVCEQRRLVSQVSFYTLHVCLYSSQNLFWVNCDVTQWLSSCSRLQQKERKTWLVYSKTFFCKLFQILIILLYLDRCIDLHVVPCTQCTSSHHLSLTMLISFDVLPDYTRARWKVYFGVENASIKALMKTLDHFWHRTRTRYNANTLDLKGRWKFLLPNRFSSRLRL